MTSSRCFSLRWLALGLEMAVLSLMLVATLSAQEVEIIETGPEKLDAEERERLTRVVQKAMEFHARHATLPEKITFKIRLFEDRRDYVNAHRAGDSVRHFGGYYSHANQEITTHKENFRWLQTLIHEAEHHNIHLTLPNCPIWLNEGLAEFFSTGYVRGSRIVFRPRKHWLSDVGKWRRLGYLPHLKEFFEMSHAEFNRMSLKSGGDQSYAIAYSVIYFLMSTEENRELLAEILTDVSQQKRSAFDAFEYHYPGGINRLEHDWKSFLRFPKGNVVF